MPTSFNRVEAPYKNPVVLPLCRKSVSVVAPSSVFMSTKFPRSCYDQTGGIVYFARMVDKIRLFAAGTLGKEYHENLGTGFDGRCCTFLGVKYDELKKVVLAGATDEAAFQWCLEHGSHPSADAISDFNDFIIKRGWRDGLTARLHSRLKEAGFENRIGDVLTMFDFIEVDEGRVPPKFL